MIGKIAKLVANVKKDQTLVTRVTETTDIVNEIGLDSLEMIDFLLALESEFQINIDFNAIEISHLSRMSELCGFIAASQAQPHV